MAVCKVTGDGIAFECPACNRVNEYPFADVRVRARDDARCGLVLPPCECGARSEIMPSRGDDTPGHHVRRIAWKRSVAAGNFLDEESRGNADAHTKAFDAFYAVEGREALKALYDDDLSTVEIRVEKKG